MGLFKRLKSAANWWNVLAPTRIVYIGDVKFDNACNNAGDSYTYFLTLANRNDPICVSSSKVAKASTISVAVTGIIAGIIKLTFTNVNKANLAVKAASGLSAVVLVEPVLLFP